MHLYLGCAVTRQSGVRFRRSLLPLDARMLTVSMFACAVAHNVVFDVCFLIKTLLVC